MRLQLVIVELDQFRCRLGLHQRIGHHHGNRLANKPHPILGQTGARRLGWHTAIPVGKLVGHHAQLDSRRLQISRCDHRDHPLAGRRIADIQSGNFRVRHGAAKHIGVGGVFRRDIIHVTPLPGQEPQILDTAHRLAFSETLHGHFQLGSTGRFKL